jgi:toxin ParE1/3/4
MPILFTPAAEVDLSDIWKYTVDTWGEIQAELYIQEISSACDKLCDGLSQEILVDYVMPGYRKILVDKHAIFFKRAANAITIIRILHQSMDVDEVL